MTRFDKLVLLIISFLVITSCDTNVLDVRYEDEVPFEDVVKNPDLIDAYLNELYRGMGHGLHEIMLASLADESHFIHGYGTNEIVQSVHSSGAPGAWSDWRLEHFQWSPLYGSISQVNRLLENIDESVFNSRNRYERVLGELFFLRGYLYHNLMRAYGGVPVITESFEIEDIGELKVPRSSFEETINFILGEAEYAAGLLPVSSTERGRASAGAALALKSRTLLFAASDLYNENPVNELVGYLSGSRMERWLAAKDAAQEVMDLGIYQLYNRYEDPVKNYTELFLENSDHEEAIMSRYFRRDRDSEYNPGLHNGPNGFRNWGGNTPIQNLIDDYEMADGSRFDWDNPAHAAAPYDNRDSRFYATILYDGAKWRQRDPRGAQFEPDGIIQTFQKVSLPDGSSRPGIDTRLGQIEPWNGSYTRYYLRKFIDPEVSHSPTLKQEVPWRFFRYTEILLNYAEASIELGDYEDARSVLNLIRERAGMPEITEKGDALRERYRNERRVEMAFEDQRYFDIRRWKTAPDVMTNALGIGITTEAEDHRDRSTYSNYEYNVILVQNRDWNDKSYFLPIPSDEMKRNENLVQNPGY
jgi:starch-binding outer membrane protein, SusD/RagB family